MANKTTLQLIANNTAGKSVTTNIQYVNPTAQPSQLRQLAEKINNLTKNTLINTNKIDVTGLYGASDKQIASITLEKTSDTLANVKASSMVYNVNFTFTSDATPYAYADTNYVQVIDPSENPRISVIPYANQTNNYAAGTIIVRVDETENYTAAEATFTITE